MLYAAVQRAIPEGMLNHIVELGDRAVLENALAYGRPEARHSRVAWIDSKVFRDCLENLARQVNDATFQIDLGEPEPLQYAVYGTGEFYDWHMDMHFEPANPQRKLSLSIQLSSAHEYEGGDLELNLGQVCKMPRQIGTAIFFPSYVLHRVAPVTRGVRKSLVCWFGGPRWR